MGVFEKNMQVLRMTGFWIDKNDHRGFVYYIKQCFVHNVAFYAFYGMFFGMPLYIYKHADNFADISESLGNVVGTSLTATMYLTFVLKNDELNELVQLLRNVDELFPPTNEHTKAIYDNTEKWSRFWGVTVTRPTFVVFTFMSATAAVVVLIEGDIENRLKFIYPFDVTRPGAFELAALTFICNFYYGMILVISCNIMIVCMFLNIVGQLKILNYKMANLRFTAEFEVQDQREGTDVANDTSNGDTEALKNEYFVVVDLNETSENLQPSAISEIDCNNKTASVGMNKGLEEIKIRNKMQDLLKECIAHHCELLKFIRAFEEHWNAFFSMNVAVCMAQSVLLLTSSAMKDGNSNLLIHIVVNALFYSMLGIFCYVSQQITLQSELLQESIYGCGWTESSKSFKKYIGIMVSVTNQPIVIKAAGFIPLSLNTFKGVLNSAYSYYMVMRSF